MRARVQKWGNSLALRIPKPFAEEAGMAEGGEVRLSITDGKLVAEPLRPPRYTLKSLLVGVHKGMVHGEENYGGPIGREAW